MLKKDKVAVLFSGGTDSTLTASLMLDEYEFVDLITFDRFGLFHTQNSGITAQVLIDKYGPSRVSHQILRFDKLFQHVSYHRYLKDIIEHGFFSLSTCGLCKLAMHLRAISYCLDNGISIVSDGANKGMHIFPAQMKEVLAELTKLYSHFGIKYHNPVYDYQPPQENQYLKTSSFSHQPPAEENEEAEQTTGYSLYQRGLAPSVNIKGSSLDRKRQPRCFGFILFNIFAKSYFLASHSLDEYQEKTVEFFSKKMGHYRPLLEEYRDNKNHKKLFG